MATYLTVLSIAALGLTAVAVTGLLRLPAWEFVFLAGDWVR